MTSKLNELMQLASRLDWALKGFSGEENKELRKRIRIIVNEYEYEELCRDLADICLSPTNQPLGDEVTLCNIVVQKEKP